MVTSIVDLHKVNHIRPEYDVYIGRAVIYTEFTKNSTWYNPFYASDYDPAHWEQCITDYDQYIDDQIMADPVKFDLNQLVNMRLGCWCITTTSYQPPYRCHGQIILRKMHERGLI